MSSVQRTRIGRAQAAISSGVRLAGGSHPADVVMVPVKYVVIKDVVKRGWLAHRPRSGPHGG
jgi:hypothetical protein